MKEQQIMERFNRYLNRSLFATQDKFMKRRYQTYVKKTQGDGAESSLTNTAFFDRMEQDKSERDFRRKIR